MTKNRNIVDGDELAFGFSEEVAKIKGKILVFDLETQNSFDEVGGQQNISKLKMSCAVVYDFLTDEFRIYTDKQIDELVEDLLSAELVIGYNIFHFDYNVLAAYSSVILHTIPTLDLIDEVTKNLGFRIKLDSLVSCTLESHKAGSGLDAIKWWREGNIEQLHYYCKEDVRLTKDLYLFGRKNGFVQYEDNHSGSINKVKVEW